MPRKEIPFHLAREISTWVGSKGGQPINGLGYFDSPPRFIEGEVNTWAYIVDGEPLVMRHMGYSRVLGSEYWNRIYIGPPHTSIYCSEKQAQQLEEAGIVSFQETPESTK